MSIVCSNCGKSFEWAGKVCCPHCRHENCRVGDTLTFGDYWQSQDSDDQQPITWRVLERKPDRMLLVALHGLDAYTYHDEWATTNWSDSDMRSWLNSDFLEWAFDDEEQECLVEVNLSNRGRFCDWNKVEGGPDTQDKVFLLSSAEAHKFFKDSADRRCKATDYAVSEGVAVSSDGYCDWWLRSPGSDGDCAANIDKDGKFDDHEVIFDNIAIRPAIYLSVTDSQSHSNGNTDRNLILGTFIVLLGLLGVWNIFDIDSSHVSEFFNSKIATLKSSSDSAESQNNSSKIYTDCQKGDSFVLGKYFQDGGYTETPIEWSVLSRQDDRLLVITKLALEARAYDNGGKATNWSSCSLRSWLNNDFLNKAFSADEQKCLLEVNLSDHRGEFKEVNAGPGTKDKVFLLSDAEYKKYCQGNANNVCKPTTFVSEKSSNVFSGNTWWWLRSPGRSADCAAFVNNYGGVSYGTVNMGDNAVRPAVYLSL